MALVVGTNSYVSVVTATAYFADRLDAGSWETAPERQQSAALVTASRAIDAMPLQGRLILSTQAMAFPRYMWTANLAEIDDAWVVNSDAEDYPVPGWVDVGIPQAVMDASCEEALSLLSITDADAARQRLLAQGLVSQTAGDASETYNPLMIFQKALSGKGLSSSVATQLMKPFISGTVRRI